MNNETYLLEKKDLFSIVDKAKCNMVRLSFPMYVSGKEVDRDEYTSIAMLESILMYLNKNNLLTKLVSIDYTDPGADHDQEPELEPLNQPLTQ